VTLLILPGVVVHGDIELVSRRNSKLEVGWSVAGREGSSSGVK
jgi:hypothetical protein